MTASTVPQDLAERVRYLERRLDDLLRFGGGKQPNLRDLNDTSLTKVTDGQGIVYRKASGRWEPGSAGGPPPFSLPGAVALSTSGRWYPPSTLTVGRLFASLTTAGTTATTVAFLRNGVSVTTVTIAAGALTVAGALSQVFTGPEVDHMQMQVTAAGTGALNLTVQPS